MQCSDWRGSAMSQAGRIIEFQFHYRPRIHGLEDAKGSESSPSAVSASFFENPDNPLPYAVQFVRQVNFGAIEAKRYFIPHPEANGDRAEFVEITEQDLIAGNFQKLNSYKNFKCTMHNKFFEVNLYQKDPVNRHHWRLNIARPASDIDL
ncbi:hypothetical protein LT330_006712 [Penicillium expansum]|nr:hypothetical protein LT330_006712 [Penicillium expansum]